MNLTGHRECVFALLDAGADTTLVSNSGKDAIMYAAAQNHYSLMEEMISYIRE
jgi:hypothetical protein